MADVAFRIVVTQSGSGKITNVAAQFDKAAAATERLNRKAKAASVQMTKMNSVALGFGAQIGARISGALLTGLEQIISAGPRMEQALTQSLSIMQATTQQQEEMGRVAQEVAAEVNISSEKAAESYFFLASAGLDTATSIKALPQVAKFAKAGMFDMAQATDLLTDAQSALGLTIRDTFGNIQVDETMAQMARVSDVLVKANTLANATVEQFSQALTTKAGPAMRTFNIEIEEGVAVLAAMADQGIKAEMAGTQFSMMLRNLTTRAVDSRAAFEKLLGKNAVFDASGNLRNLADVVKTLEDRFRGMSDEQKKAALLQLGFADRAQQTVFALLGTSDAIRRYEAELRKARGTTEEVAEKQMQSLTQQSGLLMRALEQVGTEIFAETGPALTTLVQVMTELVPVLGTIVKWGVQLAGTVGEGWYKIFERIGSVTKEGQAGMEMFAAASNKVELVFMSLKVVALSLGNLILWLIEAQLKMVKQSLDNFDKVTRAITSSDIGKKALKGLGLNPERVAQQADLTALVGLDASIGVVEELRGKLSDLAFAELDATNGAKALAGAYGTGTGSFGGGEGTVGGAAAAASKKIKELTKTIAEGRMEIFSMREDLQSGAGRMGLVEPEKLEQARQTIRLTSVEFLAMGKRAAAAGVPVQQIVEQLKAMGADSGVLDMIVKEFSEAEEETFNWNLALQGTAMLANAIGGEFAQLPGVLMSIGQGFAQAQTSAEKFGAIAAGVGQIGGMIGGRAGSAIQGAAGGAMTGFTMGGPVGAVIGGGLGLLGGLFGGPSEGEQLNDQRDAFFAQFEEGFVGLQQQLAAVGADAEGLVQAIFDADTVAEFEAAVAAATGKLQEHEEFLRLQGEAQSALNSALSEYGFSIEQTIFAQDALDEQAAKLMQDYQLLTAAGLDNSAVIEAMGDNMSDYINSALEAGATIPEAMREQVEAFIASGALLDENGVAFESAEAAGITFAETTTEKMQGLIDSIQQLVNALLGIPPVDIPVTINGGNGVPGLPGGVPGGTVGGEPIPGFAAGGIVDSPTFAMVGERGPEVVAPVAALFANVVGGVTEQLTPMVQGNNARLDSLQQQLASVMAEQGAQFASMVAQLAQRPVRVAIDGRAVRSFVQDELEEGGLIVPDTARQGGVR